MATGSAISDLTTLLVTVDPIGLSPIFLALTPRLTPRERTEVAVRACAIAFGVLALFTVAGGEILQLLGISLPAFQIAGGLLLFWTAFEMVFGARSDRKHDTADMAVRRDHISDIAAFPLAIPLLAGPGAITAVILLAGRAGPHIVPMLTLLALLAVVMLASFVAFLVADRLSGLLGATGNTVLTRLLGLLLAALAVQFVIAGVLAAGRG